MTEQTDAAEVESALAILRRHTIGAFNGSQVACAAPECRAWMKTDAWHQHVATLLAAREAAARAEALREAAAIAERQMDAFLSADTLDQAWVAGWHSAVRQVVASIARTDGAGS